MPVDPNITLGGIQRQAPPPSPFDALEQFSKLKQQQAQQQQEILRQRAEQDKLDDETALSQSLQKHAKPGGDIDTGGVLYDLQSAGRGNAVLAFQNKVVDWRKGQAEEYKNNVEARKAAFETAGRIAQGVLDSDNPQKAYTQATPQITALVGPDLTDSYWGKGYDEDTVKLAASGAKSAADNLAEHKLVLEEADKVLDRTRGYINDQASQEEKRPKLIEDWTNLLSRQLSLPGTKSEADWQHALLGASQMMSAVPEIRDAVLGSFAPHYSTQAVENARLLGMNQAQRSEELSRKETAARAAEAEDVAMTPAAIDQAAMRYAQTGDMGAMGFGKNARNDRNTIKNRAAEVYAGLNPGAQIAAYQSNKSSLVNQQKTYDMIQSWENTGLKNARVFLQQAQKVVDTGSPWINEPLRKIDEKAFGSSNVATYNAARGIVTPEFAKLLQNAGAALGGTLTDTARAEVNALLSGDFNYKQAYDVVKLFANDAENRRSSAQQQIDDIQKRIQSTPIGVKVAAGDVLPGQAGGIRTISEADIQASMKANKWTHAQAVTEAQKRGFSVQ